MRAGSVYRGWSVATGCFLGILVLFGVSYSFGVFLTPIQRDLGLSRAGVSLVFSLQTLVLYTVATLLGIAADRYGVRRMLAFGTIAFSLGIVLTVFAQSFSTLLLAYGIVTAIGLSAIYVVSYATVPRWFERRRGLASGLATSGLGVGMVAIPFAAEVLIDRFTWQHALLIIAACSAIALVVATLLIRDSPAGTDADLSKEFPAGIPEETPFDPARYRTELWALVTSKRFLLIFVGWTGLFTTIYVVFVHIVAHATELGVGERTGVLVLAVIGLTTAIARVLVGALSDRVGRFRTFVVCALVMSLSTLSLAVIDSRLGLFVFAVVFGIVYGGNGALLSPLTADLFGRANPNAVFGLVSLSFAVSGLFAPWGAGVIYDLQGAYTLAFVLSGALGIFGSGLVVLAGRHPATPR